MCGIVGVFPLNQKNIKVAPELIKPLALWFNNEILYYTVKRGKDATGIAVSLGQKLGEDGKLLPAHWSTLKQAVDTEDFFNNDGTESKYHGQEDVANIKNFLKHVINADRPFMHVIGHARAKTVGSEYDPRNNHPIIVGNIIGVHNGGVKNYKKIYDKHPGMKPLGEVDSEAIMQLFAETSNDKALDKNAVDFVCERIEGPRAVFAYNSMFPEKVVFFRDIDRPLEGGYIKELGLLILCSEKEFLKAAMNSYQRMRLLKEHDFPRLSMESITITAGEAGVIDLTKEIAPNATFRNGLVELFTAKSLLPEYRPSYNTTTTNQEGLAPYNKGKNTVIGGTTANKTSEMSDAITTELYDHSDYSTAIAQGYLDEEADANSGPGVLVPEDDLTDETPTVKSSSEFVSGTLVPDDKEDNSTEEDANFIEPPPFDDEYKRAAASKFVLDPEFYKDRPDYTIPKFKHSMERLIPNHKLTNEERAEVLQALYVPSFGDGYVEGFDEGWYHAMGYESEDAENFQLLEEENVQLQATAYKATAHMANLKNFLIAVLLCHDLVDIGPDGEILFDKHTEEFLSMASKGFSKVDSNRIRSLFSKRDKKRISSSLSKMASPPPVKSKKSKTV